MTRLHRKVCGNLTGDRRAFTSVSGGREEGAGPSSRHGETDGSGPELRADEQEETPHVPTRTGEGILVIPLSPGTGPKGVPVGMLCGALGAGDNNFRKEPFSAPAGRLGWSERRPKHQRYRRQLVDVSLFLSL